MNMTLIYPEFCFCRTYFIYFKSKSSHWKSYFRKVVKQLTKRALWRDIVNSCYQGRQLNFSLTWTNNLNEFYENWNRSALWTKNWEDEVSNLNSLTYVDVFRIQRLFIWHKTQSMGKIWNHFSYYSSFCMACESLKQTSWQSIFCYQDLSLKNLVAWWHQLKHFGDQQSQIDYPLMTDIGAKTSHTSTASGNVLNV